MANFPQLKMTAAGRNLQAKAQTGQQLKFTRVGLGDGLLAGSLDALTALVAEKQSLSIRDQQTPGDGTSILQVIATNKGLAAGFYIRELGLFAVDPDTGVEVLYSYTNAAAESDFLPAEGGAVTWEGTFDLVTVVGNAANVTAVINDFITIALKSEVNALKPYILPAGGLVGQMPRKKSNLEGDVEWFDPEIDGLDVRFKSVEEARVAVANQSVFTLQKTVTNGLAVYVAGRRLSRDDGWTVLSARQIKLSQALEVGTPVLFVNNEEAGPGESLSVGIEGPTLVYPNSSNTFTINGFDSFSEYTQSSSKGTLTRSGKVLTLVIASGEAPGTLDLMVTRDKVSVSRRVAIGSAAIEKPQIVAPGPGAVGVGFEPDISIAPFVVYPAGFDGHRKTRLQLALDAAFTQLVYDAESTTNLTTLNLGSVGVRLEPSKQYFARAKVSGDTLASAWSEVSFFNTASVYIRRPASISPIDGQIKVSTGVVFKGDAFSVYGGADVHQASRWQYSLVSDFATVAYDSGWITSPLESFAPPSPLPKATTIYARFKYRGKSLGESAWSPVVRFVTADRLKATYTQLAAGPQPRQDGASAVIGDKLYLSGGRIAASSGALFGDLWEYTISENVWRQKGGFGTPTGHTAEVINGLIYFYGGATSTGGSPSIDVVSVYDPVAGTLKAKTAKSPGGARVHHGSGVIAGKMYIFGGIVGSAGSTALGQTLVRYSPDTDTWEQLAAAPAGTGGLYSTCSAVGNKFYVVNGNKLSCYDPDTNSWSVKASYPGPAQAGQHLFSVDGMLYSYGGYYNVSGTTYTQNTLHVYDPVIDKWEEMTAGGQKAYGQTVCTAGQTVYVCCGVDAAGNGLSVNWKIN